MSHQATQEAMALALADKPEEGLTILHAAQARDNPTAFLLEALWKLEGRFVGADAVGARKLLGRAAELGHVGAARTLAGLIACGVGGSADWQAALEMLNDWSGRDPVALRQLELIASMELDGQGTPATLAQSRQLKTDPKVERVDGLPTRYECAFLVELADPRMRRATIFHQAEQRFVEDSVRRSDKAGFPIVSEWPFIRAFNRRIAAVARAAVECGEPLQVLRYAPTQEYRPHFDAIAGMDNPRVLTALIWLNEDYSGGETIFDGLGSSERGRAGDSCCSPTPASTVVPIRAPATQARRLRQASNIWPRAGFGRHEVENALP